MSFELLLLLSMACRILLTVGKRFDASRVSFTSLKSGTPRNWTNQGTIAVRDAERATFARNDIDRDDKSMSRRLATRFTKLQIYARLLARSSSCFSERITAGAGIKRGRHGATLPRRNDFYEPTPTQIHP